jgi:hypothetical protein
MSCRRGRSGRQLSRWVVEGSDLCSVAVEDVTLRCTFLLQHTIAMPLGWLRIMACVNLSRLNNVSLWHVHLLQAEVDLLKERFSQLLVMLKGTSVADESLVDVVNDGVVPTSQGPAVIEGVSS